MSKTIRFGTTKKRPLADISDSKEPTNIPGTSQ